MAKYNYFAHQNSNFIQFISCGLLELGSTSKAAFWLLRAPHCVPHCDVADAIVAAL